MAGAGHRGGKRRNFCDHDVRERLPQELRLDVSGAVFGEVRVSAQERERHAGALRCHVSTLSPLEFLFTMELDS